MSKVHGHKYLIDYLNKHKDIFLGEGGVMIEVGSTREPYKHQSSTGKLATLAKQFNMHFITVDMDPELTEKARETLLDIDPSFEAVNSKGEDFLAEYAGDVKVVYLDAFDTVLSPKHHSADRKDRYKENMDCEITNEACWQMHLDCVMPLVKKLPVGGVICIDDIYNDKDYFGKGKTAIPYLLGTKRFEIGGYKADAIIMRKIK
jgi:hypothetical protein